MFLHISCRMGAPIQPVNTVQEQESNVKGPHSASTDDKSLNSSTESRNETPKRKSDQMVKNNPS